jgi:2-aminoadipate transaminase
MSLTLSARTRHMNPSAIREILKLTERPGVLSLAGGLPSPQGFPIEALQAASARVWQTQGAQAMQYASSEGLPALREWVAQRVSRPHWRVSPEQVLITTGSQQGLDLAGKVLLDPGSAMLVEQPTYLGALQAFSAYEPVFAHWAADEHGPLPQALAAAPPELSASAEPSEPSVPREQYEPDQQGPQVDQHDQLVLAACRPRAAYLVPSFQNPTGHCIGAERRLALARAIEAGGVTLIEDNPYGELWFDAPAPDPVASHAPQHTLYLGSLSKVLAPGLRLGYVVTPPDEAPGALALRAKLLQAKQAADLHTPGFNQRLVLQLLQDGFDLDAHVARVRALYKAQRDAMAQALRQHLPAACRWALPAGGMFFWVEGPASLDALAMLPKAVAAGVAYVPGVAFYSDAGAALRHSLRLSFVTLPAPDIEEAVARLGRVLQEGC